MKGMTMTETVKAKPGDTVKIRYTGRTDEGEEFGTASEDEPIEFEVGSERVLKGFSDAVVGMEPGEVKEVRIPSDRAYGPHQDRLVFELEKSRVDLEEEPRPGDLLSITDREGIIYQARVTDVSDDRYRLDANHLLAGRDLDFTIRLMEVG
jgi:peptidylprolyl isomerase